MRSRIAFAITLPIVIACSGESGKAADSAAAPAAVAVDPAAVRQAIDSGNARFAAGMVAGDAAAATANYAENAVSMWPNLPPLRSKAAIAGAMTEGFKEAKFSTMDITTTDVMIGGDIAVETGTLVASVTPKGMKAMPDTSKYITVWQKQADGSWKIVRDIYNTSLPAPK